MKAHAQYTDTFGGEANYSWLQRAEVEAPTVRGLIRKAKAEFGLTGVRCDTCHFGDEIHIRPRGVCTVLFLDIVEDYTENHIENQENASDCA